MHMLGKFMLSMLFGQAGFGCSIALLFLPGAGCCVFDAGITAVSSLHVLCIVIAAQACGSAQRAEQHVGAHVALDELRKHPLPWTS